MQRDHVAVHAMFPHLLHVHLQLGKKTTVLFLSILTLRKVVR